MFYDFLMRATWLLLAFVSIAEVQWAHTEQPEAAPFVSDMLAAHNAVRSTVGVPPLTWSAELAGVAQRWANRLAAERRLYHHQNPHYGQNLYLISGGRATPESVVHAWAAESRDYDYRSNSCRSRCGHYTQIVWRNTKQIGCAVSRTQQTEVWVCEYNPPGNYVGERPY
jgi:uncharacterized protein YkwD